MNRLPGYLSTVSSLLVLGVMGLAPVFPSPSLLGVEVLESKAEYVFAQQITFTLRAVSDVEVDAVYLLFRSTGDQQTRTVEMDVGSSQEINASYVHNLRVFPLPPFTSVEFWWQVKDITGTEWAVPAQQVEYVDNRFSWQSLADGPVAVHWIEGRGDSVLGQAVLDVALSSLERTNVELQAPVPESIDVYVYDAQHNLDAAMMLSGRDWIVGQAHPDLEVIIVAIPRADGYTSLVQRYVPHEMTHLLVYQAVTPAAYEYVPEWLDEGLATANEWLPTPEFVQALEEARTAGDLLPLAALCTSFPSDPYSTQLAYAQSASVVRFIRQQYGGRGIRALLNAYAGGASCTSGVQDSLGISLDRLDVAWRASLEPQAGWLVWVDRVGIWLGLLFLSVAVALPMVGQLRRR